MSHSANVTESSRMDETKKVRLVDIIVEKLLIFFVFVKVD
jgi:hypothetical protein